MAGTKKLNLTALRSRIVRNVTTKEALKDVIPFQWSEQKIVVKRLTITK